MTFCSQSRHATTTLYFDQKIIIFKESRIRTYDEKTSTDLQSAALNRSAISSLFSFNFFSATTVVRIKIKISNSNNK